MNSANNAHAVCRWNRSARISATPIRVWVAVNSTSSTWRPSSISEVPPPPAMWAIGSDPTNSVHWLTFDEISVAMAAVPLPRAAKMIAMMNSGASEASGASHCTSRNLSMPSSCRHRPGFRRTVPRRPG